MQVLSPIQVENSKLQVLHNPLLDRAGVELWVKREDLIHPQVSGNKWRKLKYNLAQAKEEGYDQLLTFGGAYSNHILATAAASKLFGFRSIGIIRGEEHLPLNSTLSFAQDCGMELHYLDRTRYREKHTTEIVNTLIHQYGRSYIIPEGGSNANAVKGCAEIIKEIDIDFDCLCTACGTGGTIAGLVAGLKGEKRIMGFPVLKGATFLYDEIKSLLKDFDPTSIGFQNWDLQLDYHFGGYAKNKAPLKVFMEEFEMNHQISLEHVYTGKLFFGLFDLIKQGYFPKGSTIVALHTGGLRKF